MSDEDISRSITESADKIRVETKVKRGTETRDQDELKVKRGTETPDQDELKVKIKGDDPEAVVEKLNDTVERLHETAETVRGLQPSGETDE